MGPAKHKLLSCPFLGIKRAPSGAHFDPGPARPGGGATESGFPPHACRASRPHRVTQEAILPITSRFPITRDPVVGMEQPTATAGLGHIT